MNRAPKNIFAMLAFSRIITTLTTPSYIYYIGLIPFIFGSAIHIFLAIQTHEIFIYYAEKLNTKSLNVIIRKVLGKKWELAFNVIAFSNFLNIIVVQLPQLKICIIEINKFISDNTISQDSIIYLLFVIQLIFFYFKLSHFIKLQLVNALIYAIIIISIITLAIITNSSNIMDHLFHTPQWYQIPLYFNANNISFSFIFYLSPFLDLVKEKSIISNKRLLNQSILSHFIIYLIFGICGFIAIDQEIFQQENHVQQFFGLYFKQNIPILLLNICYIYYCFWCNGFLQLLSKKYFKNFVINQRIKNNKLEKKKFINVYHIISLIYFLVIYINTDYYLPIYSLLSGNISFLFFSIILPYNLRYNPEIRHKDEKNNSQQSQINQYNNLSQNNNQQNQNKIDKRRILQINDQNNEIEIEDHLILNNPQQSYLDKQEEKLIRIKYKTERKKSNKYWFNGILIFIGYTMSGIQIIYYFYSYIYEQSQNNT